MVTASRQKRFEGWDCSGMDKGGGAKFFCDGGERLQGKEAGQPLSKSRVGWEGKLKGKQA